KTNLCASDFPGARFASDSRPQIYSNPGSQNQPSRLTIVQWRLLYISGDSSRIVPPTSASPGAIPSRRSSTKKTQPVRVKATTKITAIATNVFDSGSISAQMGYQKGVSV